MMVDAENKVVLKQLSRALSVKQERERFLGKHKESQHILRCRPSSKH